MKTESKIEMADLREQVRRAEFESVKHLFKPSIRILELGGGNGYQAALISAIGCDVLSIDVADRVISPPLAFPVTNYDGRTIPAEDHSFDVVYSSNVLEHIPDVSCTLNEVRRVLKPGGTIIHFLPSPAWRFWNSIGHCGNVLRRLWAAAGGPNAGHALGASAYGSSSAPRRSKLVEVLSWCFLGALRPHGEYRNAIVELFKYRRSRWRGVFESAGFKILAISGNGLFYSGYFLSPLTISARRRISRLTGQSCSVFIMKLN